MARMTPREAIDFAVERHRAGEVDRARWIYQQILQHEPENADALHLLGVIAYQKGQAAEAVDLISRAISVDSRQATYFQNLALAQIKEQRLTEAESACREALRLNPDLVEAHNSLGNILKWTGRLAQAVDAYREAIRQRPQYPEAHNNLGNVLAEIGKHDEAKREYLQALEINPQFADAYNNLANLQKDSGLLDEAVITYQKCLAVKPDYAEAHNNLANALKDKGCLDEALAAYRSALRIKPDMAGVHSNLVYLLHFHPGYTEQEIYNEATLWRRRHAEHFSQNIPPHANDRSVNRRLRIGYVSSAFCSHACSFFSLTLLKNHDRNAVEIFCYSGLIATDAVTERHRSCADHWRNIAGASDAQVAEMVRRDAIDILVDLSVHLSGNRLLVFARKPAPVQVTWLGYPGTTGLTMMDYRFTDPYLDPDGACDAWHSEESVRLPDTFWCYDPMEDYPAINELPAATWGNFTFGCMNNFCKVNHRVLDLWSEVMRRVAGSRIMIVCDPGQHRERLLGEMESRGVDRSRIELVPRLRSRTEYLKRFNEIDLTLDTFPYNGHTTTMDGFWMGVPLVTLAGRHAVCRAGVSLLTNMNLPELIAWSPEQFVQVAVRTAGDLGRLAGLRRELRARMQESPLMDGPRFARGVEDAYRMMWRRWCVSAPPTR